jgi:hypothetical protein
MMSDRSKLRRFAIFLCLGILLLAALTPGAAGLPLAFLVFAVWLLAAIPQVLLLACTAEDSHAQKALALIAFSPRPPPAK